MNLQNLLLFLESLSQNFRRTEIFKVLKKYSCQKVVFSDFYYQYCSRAENILNLKGKVGKTSPAILANKNILQAFYCFGIARLTHTLARRSVMMYF